MITDLKKALAGQARPSLLLNQEGMIVSSCTTLKQTAGLSRSMRIFLPLGELWK